MDKTYLITGASRGIGRAIAKRLATDGNNLYITCRNNIDELSKFAFELSLTHSVKCIPIQCDAGNYADVEKLFNQIARLDGVINNAGIAWLGLLTDMTPSEWDDVIRTNLTSIYNSSRLAIPLMLREGEGRIINISSVWGNVGASTEVAYSASKGGVNAFTRALAKELAPSNIAVNAIACGVVDTDMNRDHLSKEDLEQLVLEIPAGRLCSPAEVAELVINILHSPVYLTGQVITMDGGWT